MCEMDDTNDMVYNIKCIHKMHLSCCKLLLSISPYPQNQPCYIQFQFARAGICPQCKTFPESWYVGHPDMWNLGAGERKPVADNSGCTAAFFSPK
jgi:hypothetical protein